LPHRQVSCPIILAALYLKPEILNAGYQTPQQPNSQRPRLKQNFKGVYLSLFILDMIYRIDGIFPPTARSPIGRRPFYPDDPVDPVHFSFEIRIHSYFLKFLFELNRTVFCPAAGLPSGAINMLSTGRYLKP
jgi:hypothetical protein